MRIIGGIHRSRVLRAPHGTTTRPTSDRVREALFGILTSAGVVENAHVVDVYAGSGALGLEALSRGARRVTLVESGRQALVAARHNVLSLGAGDDVRVLAADVAKSAGRIAREGPFDLVLADPPWALVESGEAARALSALAAAGAYAEHAWVVLEHSGRTSPPPLEPLVLAETRRYGDTALAFYKPAILGPPRRGSTRGVSF